MTELMTCDGECDDGVHCKLFGACCIGSSPTQKKSSTFETSLCALLPVCVTHVCVMQVGDADELREEEVLKYVEAAKRIKSVSPAVVRANLDAYVAWAVKVHFNCFDIPHPAVADAVSHIQTHEQQQERQEKAGKKERQRQAASAAATSTATDDGGSISAGSHLTTVLSAGEAM